MSALVSVREPGELRQYFERKRAEGRKHSGGQCGAHKLVHRVCAGRNNRPFKRPITTT
ncbi:MAG: hypothetical protein IPH05_10495 [Flavobacteriales bacterium]|nr:hypothetical protein [Flavobacteriales bacterium]